MKVIHIMGHAPAYEEYSNQSRPLINWDTPDGSWVGIWEYDWADLLGKEVLGLTNGLEYEVWQPDTRADKIYTHIFPNGLVHRLIPAAVKRYQYGLKRIWRLVLDDLVVELNREATQNRVIVLIDNLHFLKCLGDVKGKIKIIFSFMGDIWFPIQKLFAFTFNIPAKINLLKDHFSLKNSFKFVSFVTYMNDRNLHFLKRFYSGPIKKITMGADFKYWRKIDKDSSRQDLCLEREKTILFSSSRLNNLKQIDHFIRVLNRLSRKYDFLYIISGHGTREYEARLREIAKPLIDQNRIEFTGYIYEEKLLRYYSACDLFVLTSISEGASVSVIKAFACETPVFTTDVGNTAELLKEHGAGIVVPIRDYNAWEDALMDFLSGGAVSILPLEIARQHYHWPNVAKNFLGVYQSVV